METDQLDRRDGAVNFLARGLRWEVGVVALPWAPAQWTPIQMAATGMVHKAGYPRRQGPDVNPQRKIYDGVQCFASWMPNYSIQQSSL